MTTTQCQRVLKLLRDANGGWVSTNDILRQTWITRAPARIHELLKLGYQIEKGARDEHGFQTYRLLEALQPPLL